MKNIVNYINESKEMNLETLIFKVFDYFFGDDSARTKLYDEESINDRMSASQIVTQYLDDYDNTEDIEITDDVMDLFSKCADYLVGDDIVRRDFYDEEDINDKMSVFNTLNKYI